MGKKLNYSSRNFADMRSELINFTQRYYPDVMSDFNDASVGMMMIELNAGVGDILSYHTDRMFNETQIDFAKERRSVLSLARTYGLNVPGRRPAITMAEFTITLPTDGDHPDWRYASILREGAQATGNGLVFETKDDCDFSSPFRKGGIPNRKIIPITNQIGSVTSYEITKLELVVNGVTKVYQRPINPTDEAPFFEVILPEDNIISITSIITLPGTDYDITPNTNQFLEFKNRWWEMDALVDDKVFISDPNGTTTSDNPSVNIGKYVTVNKRFIREYTDKGFTKITFGSGVSDLDSLCDFDISSQDIKQIGNIIDNLSLGEIPKVNSTMFIKYRIGGGDKTNIGQNVLKQVANYEMFVNGPNPQTSASVNKSLAVRNYMPALGGKNEPSVEEIRNLIRYNFNAQNRGVTIKDYNVLINKIPGEFGVPFRVGVMEHQNKVAIYTIGKSPDGTLSNSNNSTMKENIAEYLSDYRMMNDYVTISDGRIVNLAVDVDVFIEKGLSQSEIVSGVIKVITKYLDKDSFEMGDNIYLGQLIEMISNLNGVLNVVDIKIYNKVDNAKYSHNEISQPLLDPLTREIDLLGQYTIFGEPTTMFEVKFPKSDIRCRVKT